MHERTCLLAEKILDRDQLQRLKILNRDQVWSPWLKAGNSPLLSESWCFLLYTWIVLWLLHTSACSTETPRFLYCEICIIFRLPRRRYYYFSFEFFLVTSSKIHTKFFNHSPFWSHGDKVLFSFPCLLFLILKNKEIKHSPDVLWSHSLLTLERFCLPQRSDSLIYGFLTPPQFLSYNVQECTDTYFGIKSGFHKLKPSNISTYQTFNYILFWNRESNFQSK